MKKTFSVVILPGVVAIILAARSVVSQGTSPTAIGSWNNTDVGSVKAAGGFREMGSTYEVSGSGWDLFGTEDAFHFVHQSWQDDCVIIARVLSITGPNGGGKAGLMIRSGVKPEAVNVVLALSGINRFTFQRRLESGEPSERDAFPS